MPSYKAKIMNASIPCAVPVTLTPAEQRAVSRVLQRYLPLFIRRRLRLLNMASWAFHLCCFWMLFSCVRRISVQLALFGEDMGDIWWAMGAVIASALVFTATFVYEIALRKQAAVRPLATRQFVYSLSAEGFVSEEAGRSRNLYFWPAVERVVREHGFILVFIDQTAAFSIPLRAFAHDEAAAAFWQQLNFYWSAYGQK
jgi:hypothetical protein